VFALLRTFNTHRRKLRLVEVSTTKGLADNKTKVLVATQSRSQTQPARNRSWTQSLARSNSHLPEIFRLVRQVIDRLAITEIDDTWHKFYLNKYKVLSMEKYDFEEIPIPSIPKRGPP
jgi:hypothetical protein